MDLGVDPGLLDEIQRILPEGTFAPVMAWLSNLLVSSAVIHEVEEASSRISTLAGAMRSHIHMDRSAAMRPVDLHGAIDDTLTILNRKLRRKGIRVERTGERFVWIPSPDGRSSWSTSPELPRSPGAGERLGPVPESTLVSICADLHRLRTPGRSPNMGRERGPSRPDAPTLLGSRPLPADGGRLT